MGPERLGSALEASLVRVRALAGPLVVLFSGGVDSGLLAWELRGRPETSLFTVGVPGSSDLDAAARSAPLIGLPWTGRSIEPRTLDETAAELWTECDAVPPRERSLLLSLAVALRLAPPGRLVCGQGADELFFGYAHFRGLDAAAAERRRVVDLDRLETVDWPRTQRVARRFGHDVLAPYLDPAFVETALQLPTEERWPEREPKGFWRALALARGLPRELALRPKRALQFGTGIDRWLRQRTSGRTPNAGSR